jgi:hypothetical protein
MHAIVSTINTAFIVYVFMDGFNGKFKCRVSGMGVAMAKKFLLL